jgi:hypothetical protein
LPGAVRACQADVVLVGEATWPEGPWAQDLFALDIGLVMMITHQTSERFRPLAEQYPVVFLPPRPSPETLWMALLTARTAQLRQAHWHAQVARLQQRLADRIVIERAKGILVQRLGITEEEAYKRLRVLSRRQRRQIRDIAQSLLDTQSLLLPESNGFLAENHLPEGRCEPDNPLPRS